MRIHFCFLFGKWFLLKKAICIYCIAGIHYKALNFALFSISRVLAKIEAITYFGHTLSIHMLNIISNFSTENRFGGFANIFFPSLTATYVV